MGNKAPAPAAAPPRPEVTPATGVAGMRVLEPEEVKGDFDQFYSIPSGSQKLGRGHYGSVTVCYHRQTREKCAVKTVAKLKPRHIDMLKNEIAIMRSLNHPNIITLYDAFEDENNVYLVMEVCEGGELFDRIIQKQHFTEAEAARVMRTLLSAVAFCHRSNIVHRDLKPENFLLTSRDDSAELKVIDFGLSMRFEPGEVMHNRVGTPYYIAPEVLNKAYGPECDLWSCGVVLYILLCGYPPFWGDRDQEIFRKVRRGHVAFEGPEWEQVSDAAKNLIMRLLCMSPSERITATDALNHPWIIADGGFHGKIISSRVFTSMQRFTLFRSIKQLSLIYMARNIPETELAPIQQIFKRLDIRGNGRVYPQDFHRALSNCGHMSRPEESRRVMDAMDVARQGFITITEFAAATLKRAIYLNEGFLHDAFAAIDVEDSGNISVENVQLALGDKDATRAQQTVLEADYSETGVISYADFFRSMCGGETVG